MSMSIIIGRNKFRYTKFSRFGYKYLCVTSKCKNLSFISQKYLVYVAGVQQGSQHGESKQSQARKAIIRMLGK